MSKKDVITKVDIFFAPRLELILNADLNVAAGAGIISIYGASIYGIIFVKQIIHLDKCPFILINFVIYGHIPDPIRISG